MYAGISALSVQELLQLHNPPAVVKKIATAILALLGVIGTIDVRNERDPRAWKFFRIKLSQTTGSDGLIRRMSCFDARNAKRENIQMARRQLQGISMEIVMNVNKASGAFYLWVCNAIKHAES